MNNSRYATATKFRQVRTSGMIANTLGSAAAVK